MKCACIDDHRLTCAVIIADLLLCKLSTVFFEESLYTQSNALSYCCEFGV